MNEEQKTMTIICDNEDCRTKYILSVDTLKTAGSVTVICKNCGDIQKIVVNETGGITINHIR